MFLSKHCFLVINTVEARGANPFQPVLLLKKSIITNHNHSLKAVLQVKMFKPIDNEAQAAIAVFDN